METTIEYWGYIGIMEKKMETTILLFGGFRACLGPLLTWSYVASDPLTAVLKAVLKVVHTDFMHKGAQPTKPA